MIFFKNDEEKLIEKQLDKAAFFTISGGVLGIIFGGSFGLFKGIPLKTILPKVIFRSSAFFCTNSAVQGALEIIRNEKDSWNPLIAGGWTGFIFGHGITRNLKLGLGLGLNGALLNWAVQAFTLPRSFDYLKDTLEILNPIMFEDQSAPLKERIDTLKAEISTIKNSF